METWRERLAAAIAADACKRSMRDVSIAAGLSAGYVHGILKDGKEPTLDRFMRICEVLDVSAASVLTGADLSRETETILRAIEGNKDVRSAILVLLNCKR